MAEQRIKRFTDLVAWQKAYHLGKAAYRASDRFPSDERFGLTSQVRRGAISIASNIAEGYGRGSLADYVRFLKVARGALYELDTQFMFAVDFEYVQEDGYAGIRSHIDETERVLAGLIRSLEEKKQ